MSVSQPSYPRRPPHYASSTSPAPAVSPWLLRITLLGVTTVILVALVLIMLVAAYAYSHRDEIHPGVSSVLGLNLAGMSRQEASDALAGHYTYPERATFAFIYGDETWEYSASDLGVSLDIAATVDAAYRAGRGGSWLSNLLDQLDLRLNGLAVAPVVVYNETEAQRLLAEIADARVNRPLIDATLTVRDGKAEAPPSQIGRLVDVPATLSLLRREVTALNTRSTIPLVVDELQPTVRDASEAAAQVNRALAAPIEFYIDPADGTGVGPWLSQVDSLEAMLVIDQVTDDGEASYAIGVNLDEARAFLERLAPQLATAPSNARFVFDDATRQLTPIEHSSYGRALDVEQTLAQFEVAYFAENPQNRRVRLLFQSVPPAIPDTASAAELGITGLVVQKTTYFYGSSAARRKNIEVATANFHGLVIAPGAVFSFNEWLGDVSAESGYEQGLIIVGNQTITGVGGGVCQVATTAFQTAFYGGYPILERVEHAYRVGYYEEGEGPGMDATVYSPIVDFRFVNDTPYHLLIETYVNANANQITWKFYSTSLGRRVEKDGPYVRNQKNPPPPIYRASSQLSPGQVRQVDYAVSGADVYVYRTVYEGDRVIADREEFASHYVPWASQFEVAPGDSRING